MAAGVKAIPVTNLFLRPVFQLVGTIADRRSMLYIESELPLEVDSYEQGVAMLAAAVGRGHLVDCFTLKPALWPT